MHCLTDCFLQAKRAAEEAEEEAPAKKAKKGGEASSSGCCRVFVGGLSFDATEEDLKDFLKVCYAQHTERATPRDAQPLNPCPWRLFVTLSSLSPN